MKKLFFLLVALSCVLLNCSKDNKGVEDPNEEPKNPAGTTLSLSPQDLVFEVVGGWKEFTINCSGAWTLTGGSAWCQPGATSGSGRSQVKVMAEASTLTSDRNVNLTIRCGSQTKVLAVTQKGVNALTLTKDKFEVESDGGDLTVTLQANVECTSTIPSAFSSWIKKSPGTKAMTSQSFRYTVSPNEDTQKREGYIVFTGGTKKDTVYVYQSAKTPTEESSLILSEDTYNLSADAQEITVELKTNIDYEVIVPDTLETWVSHLSTRALRTDKLHFSIAENEGDNARSAVVIIKEQGGELTDTLHIHQAKQELVEPIARFPKNEYILVSEACSEIIEFSVPDAWQASISYEEEDIEEWLSLSAKDGKAGKAKLTMTAMQNATMTLRQAFIDITFGAKKQRLMVTQEINENTDITEKFDPDFARVLQEKGYIKDAKHITGGEVSKITEVNVYSSQLTSLRGIEYFVELTNFRCYDNQLSSLDVSKNTKLFFLECNKNQLTTLNVSKNANLEYLYCYDNCLTALDINENAKLKILYCNSNKISALCVNKHATLANLNCQNNKLTTLDVSECVNLEYLYCSNNPGNGEVFPLTAWFDESNMPQGLSKEWTYNGKRITLQLQRSGSEDPYLVLSQKNLEMSASGGTVAVTVSTNVAYDVVIPAEAKTWLSRINGENDEIRFSVVANNNAEAREAKIVVKARDEELSDTLHICQAAKTSEEEKPTEKFSQTVYSLGYQANTITIEFVVPDIWQASVSYEGEDSGWLSLSMRSGEAGAARLTVTATKNTAMTLRQAFIDITFGEKKQRLTVTQGINENTDITDKFDPDFARVLQEKGYIKDAKHITGGEISKITEINVNGTQLTSLMGIEYFISLKKLECIQNEISVLDVSKNTELTHLICWSNQLANLDVSKNTALVELNCDVNKLKTLDVTKNTELTKLCSSTNELTTLNVTENTKLRALACTHNQLTILDVSKNTELAELKCWNNPGNGTVFPLTAWFDEDNMPLYQLKEWTYNGKRITLQLQKSGSEEPKPEAPYLTLSDKNLEVSASGGAAAVTVSTNVEYDVVIPTETKTWLNKINGESNEIRFYIKANEGYEIREAKVVVKARDKELSDTLHISQAAKAAPVPYLTLSEKNMEVSATGGAATVTVSTNVEYDVVIPAAATGWISRINGGDNEIRLNIGANDSYDSREAKVVVKARDRELSDTLHISQAAKAAPAFYLSLSQNSVKFALTGGMVGVTVNTNVEYDVIIPEEAKTWISQIDGGVDEIRFNINDNAGYGFREAQIVVKARNVELSDILHIIQEDTEIYIGDIQLTSESDITNFCARGYSSIQGNLIISGNLSVTSLEGLNCLTSISGDFEMNGAFPDLVSFEGLNNLVNIGGSFNLIATTSSSFKSLKSFAGLENLKKIDGNFKITSSVIAKPGIRCTSHLSSLTSFSGLNNLTSIGGDFEINSSELYYCNFWGGLAKLNTIGGNFRIISSSLGNQNPPPFSLNDRTCLTSIGGDFEINYSELEATHFKSLYNLGRIGGDFKITDSFVVLTSFDGLGRLRSIGGNFEISDSKGSCLNKLESFAGLGNLETIGGSFKIVLSSEYSEYTLSSLVSFSGLNRLMSIGGDFEINSSFSANRTSNYFLEKLTSFKGLDRLETIGGNFKIISSQTSLFLVSFSGLSSLKSIRGNFEINSSNSLNRLASFEGLESLETIGGNFKIISSAMPDPTTNMTHSLNSLSSFGGLNNLISIGGDFEINSSASTSGAYSLDALSSFEGLENLKTIGGNFKLTSSVATTAKASSSLPILKFNGLNSLMSIGGDFEINSSASNPNTSPTGGTASSLSFVSSFSGLESLERIGGDFRIIAFSKSNYNVYCTASSLDRLSSCRGLNGLTSIGGDFEIKTSATNPKHYPLNKFSSFIGLENLESVGGNLSLSSLVALTSIDGFSGLRNIGKSLSITDCTKLIDFCAIENIMQTMDFGYTVSGNAYNPTKEQILNGQCSK